MAASRRVAVPGLAMPRRPQLIDQRVAVANPFFPFDTGQSVPQCQQPFAAERGGMQFFFRSDDNLALTDCGRCIAAQRDSVIADDVRQKKSAQM
jgi:hypothetical protein